jgi:hypothetical protein
MQYLSELERGRKEASSEVLAAVTAALRVELADLLAEVGRELAAAQPAGGVVIRLGTDLAGPGQAPGSVQPPAQPTARSRAGGAVCLLAA